MKTKLMLVGLIGASMVLAACGGGGKKDANYGSKNRGKPDKVVVQPSKPPAPVKPAPAAKWERIGRAEMKAANKSGQGQLTITPDRKNRAIFGALQFAVSGAPVTVHDIQVVFTDGTTWTETLNQKFQKGGTTERTVRLPLLKRPVKHVSVTYRLENFGKATLTLSGR